MPSIPLAFALDLLVSILLVAMIVYGVILNRKLTALRSNKAELDVLIHSFNDACTRAEAGVRTLRSATEEAQRLQQYLARGQMLRDDMSFLIERGTGLADRLEGTVRTARSEVQTQTGETPRRGGGRGSQAVSPGQSAPQSAPLAAHPGGVMAAARPVAPTDAAAAMKPANPGPAFASAVNMGRGDAAGESAGRPIFTAAGLANGVGLASANANHEEEREEGETPSPRQRAPRERASLRGEVRGGDVAAPRSRAEKELLDALRAKR
ncbi:MAG: DUF6468 domain-containing protein [Candidatus Symbiobacter sp.]|nr:DUF6468 domain-containing protein [Candidatus Symbiobacter sp.]